MIVKNKKLDLIYKKTDNIVMISDRLNIILDLDSRFIYALISNFENGIDVEYILELMKSKEMTQEDLYKIVKNLLDLEFIEDTTNSIDLDKMKLEFEIFKKNILK